MQHPYKALLALAIMTAVCWLSALVILNSRTCCVCGRIRFVPNITTSYPFYCKDCIVEVH